MKKKTCSLKKQNVAAVFGAAIRYIFLISYSYVLIYPFIFIISNTFKAPLDYYDPTVNWVPKHFSVSSIPFAIKALDFWKSLRITLLYEIVAALMEVFSCMVAAYGLARFEFRGKKILSALMLLSIFMPSTMIIVPSYVNFRYMDFLGVLKLLGGLVGKELRPSVLDTPLVFYLPSLLAVGLKSGLFIYIYSQFFKGLPKELEEAASIDGAGAYQTFFKIVVPSATVPIVTVSLFSVIWHWNDYYLAQMYLSSNFPLSVNLANIYSKLNAQAGVETINKISVVMSGCLLVIIPMIVFFLCMQKKFVSSIAYSGIVG